MNIRYTSFVNLNDYKINEWYSIDESLTEDMYDNGFYCVPSIPDIIRYTAFNMDRFIGKIEVKGKHYTSMNGREEYWEKIKILWAYQLNKDNLIKIGLYAAQLVLPLYQEKYPHDKRPERAIESIKDLKKEELNVDDISIIIDNVSCANAETEHPAAYISFALLAYSVHKAYLSDMIKSIRNITNNIPDQNANIIRKKLHRYILKILRR